MRMYVFWWNHIPKVSIKIPFRATCQTLGNSKFELFFPKIRLNFIKSGLDVIIVEETYIYISVSWLYSSNKLQQVGNKIGEYIPTDARQKNSCTWSIPKLYFTYSDTHMQPNLRVRVCAIRL